MIKMTEEQVVESALEEQETEVTPKPSAPSVPSGDQPTSPASSDDDVLERLAQSIKDRRFAAQEKELTEIKTQLSELTSLLKSDSQPTAKEVPGRTDGVDDWAYAEAMSAQYLDEAGIAYDDPDYKALSDRYKGKVTPQQWLDIAQGHIKTRSTKAVKQESVTEAAGATAPGKTVVISEDETVESLANRLAEINTSGKTATDPKLRAEREELRAKLDELSPPVEVGIDA
jgi:hypothetical protein